MSALPSPSPILEGPLLSGIARFGAPLALGMFLQNTFNLVDAYLIAQLPPDTVGPNLGALGLCDQLAALGTILSYGITTATGALLAQRQGANDEAAVRQTVWQSLFLVGLLSVVFGILGIFFAHPILAHVIGAKGAVAAQGTTYLRVMVGGSFSIFLLLHLTTIQRALGSSKTPAALLVLGNVLNLLLALPFIFGDAPPALLTSWLGQWPAAFARALHIPALGMLGAAWATVLARTAVLVPNVFVLATRYRLGPVPSARVLFDFRALRALLELAWPSSFQFVLRIGSMLVLNALVARYFTSELDQTATTAMGLVFRVDTLALFVAMGWGSAAQTFVGQNLGARQQERAWRSGWVTALWDALTTFALAFLLAAWGPALLRVFCQDPPTLELATRYLHTVAPSYVALGVGVVLGHAMTGAGAAKTSLGIDLATLLGFFLPAAWATVGLFSGGLSNLFAVVALGNVLGALGYALVYGRRLGVQNLRSLLEA